LKAIVCTKYGPPEVLLLKEVENPLPKEDEVLVRVHSTTATRGDSRMRSFTVPFWQWLPARLYLGIHRPKRAITGMELSGIAESTGSRAGCGRTKYRHVERSRNVSVDANSRVRCFAFAQDRLRSP
jgi:NADPH:quinone reductase-like Zn-dependent oxidoreductase